MSTVRLAYLFAFDLSEASPSNDALEDFRPVVSRGVDIDMPPSETWAEMSFVEQAPYSGTMVPAWANTVITEAEGTYVGGVQPQLLALEYYFRPQDFGHEPPRPLGKDTIQLGVVLPDGVSVLQPKTPLPEYWESPDAIFCSSNYDTDGYWKASLTVMVGPSVSTHLIAGIRVFVIVGGEPVPEGAFWTNFVLSSETP